MTKTISKRNILYSTLTAIVVLVLLTSTLETNMPSHMAQAISSQTVPGPAFPPDPGFTQSQMNSFISSAINVPGIKAWSDKWQYNFVDLAGTTTPVPKWQRMMLHLYLPPTVSAPKTCDMGWQAIVVFDLDTGKIVGSVYPNSTTSCFKSQPAVMMGDPAMNTKNGVSPNTVTLHAGFAAAGQSDILNTNNVLQGTYANIVTPSFDGTYSSLSGATSQEVNARFSPTAPQNYLQSGWMIAGPNGCTSNCFGIMPANSEHIVYADNSVSPYTLVAYEFGYPYNIPNWVNGQTETVEVYCYGGAYQEQAAYGSNLYQHKSNVGCSAKEYGDDVTNSVFMESTNTDNNWTSHITSTPQASSAMELLNSAWGQWQTSNNQDRTCTGGTSISSVLASGHYLKLGGTATWSYLNNMPVACW
ncbi:MAG: hypothetical protein KGL95_04505, partial [Patescibacteria group bacterium]|nr:hypothetical protein [Patescibacteria group bacterium]